MAATRLRCASAAVGWRRVHPCVIGITNRLRNRNGRVCNRARTADVERTGSGRFVRFSCGLRDGRLPREAREHNRH